MRAFNLRLVILATLIVLTGCNRTRHTPSEQPNQKLLYQSVTGDDVDTSRSKWDRFYDTNDYVYGKDPTPFLAKNLHKIPVGRALVLAMSEGRNAVYLARKGFRVEGVDISEVALRKARRLAKEFNVEVTAINGNIKDFEITPDTYSLILTVTYFRESVIPKIKAGLIKGGMVLFESYTDEHLKNPTGMSIPAQFLVKKGQLKELFRDFDILVYEETNDGKEAMARLLARKK